MQNVGASWLMTLLTPSPLLVALMQTATSLPVFLVGLPAGALADVVDRRKLLLTTQSWMLLVALLLGVLTMFNMMSAWLLLTLTFLLGLGSALNAPAWQAVVPELVGRRMIATAVALNSAGFNLARAIGPAIGGIVVAAFGPAAVFLLNAASFVGVLVVIYRWKRAPTVNSGPPERVMGAIVAGMRYTRHSPSLKSVLIRTAVFIVPASALWALLPVVANHDLNLGAEGYGLLLGSLGVGAVIGALVLPRLRQRMSTDLLMVSATFAFALATLAPGVTHSMLLLLLLLAIGGLAWISMTSSLNVSAQSAAPNWVRARALGIYLLVFQGGMAVGSFAWGSVADLWGNGTALTAGAVLLAMSTLATVRWRLHRVQSLDLRPAEQSQQPPATDRPSPDAGPVLVTVEYHVAPDNAAAFVDAMQRVGRMRRRIGASQWALYEDPASPGRFIETYYAATWAEHLRQYTRATITDQRIEARALSFQAPGSTPIVTHLIAARPTGRRDA
jgi:MFS family permease